VGEGETKKHVGIIINIGGISNLGMLRQEGIVVMRKKHTNTNPRVKKGKPFIEITILELLVRNLGRLIAV